VRFYHPFPLGIGTTCIYHYFLLWDDMHMHSFKIW